MAKTTKSKPRAKRLSLEPIAILGELTRKCCMWQINKKVEGKRSFRFAPEYCCTTGGTQIGEGKVGFVLADIERSCDQLRGFPTQGSWLEATGKIMIREDGLAQFSGNFVITMPKSQRIFRGRIVLLDRIGSHHPPFGTEPCNAKGHIEGWLEGQGLGRLSRCTLRAIFVGKGDLRGDAASKGGALVGQINGILTSCPLQ